MSDVVFIHGLELECVVGVYEEERGVRRPVRIDLDLEADLSPGLTTDEISDTLSYEDIYQAVRGLVEGSSYRLLEALAEAIAKRCLDFERVASVRVRLDKKGIFPKAEETGVLLVRKRDEVDAP